ncbi:hypothetical protein L1987_13733 [Smallanthus sonchifolius]|uniref:Uncharacterized protein n=1 Tax=Smallanthus sonchifolius TaxID=185202 RepID=A0ACB9JJH1_9ASTR|nr:hypothetical protein L1987_13733 [Smallanthus sonchifolius]
MLSRAARNAYSWWWASHIRTKQSKWLDQNLLDMEEKVEYILKIITEDGDSFRVRAEQYYQKRPETERVKMSFDEEEYEDFTSNFDEHETMVPINANVPLPPKQNLPKMGSVVQAMIKKKSKMPKKMMLKKGLVKIGGDENASRVSTSSGLSKDEALHEIDKLQKDILGFQTEKEFVKSSYENALSKYREIENKINEMHTKISNLQHEFAVGEAIDDHDAQTQMSSFALKMCKESLDKLKHKQKRFKTEAVVEHHRVDDIRKKFEALIARDNNNTDLKNLEQTNEHVKDNTAKIEELKGFEEINGALSQQEHLKTPNMEISQGNNQEGFVESQTTIKIDQKEYENIEDKKAMINEEILATIDQEITISEVAEKIEQLVDMAITLETELTSQTALVMRLRFEIDELHEKLHSLEQENSNLVDESNNKNIKIKKLEEELERVKILDKKIKVQNVQLETSFDEASVSLDKLSKELLIAKPDEDIREDDVVFQAEKEKAQKNPRFDENHRKDSDDSEVFVKKPNEKDEGEQVESTESRSIRKDQDVDCNGEEDTANWNLIFPHGIDLDSEQILVEEYTSTLKNFKELKQKLNETEKRNRARSFKSAVQMKILRNSNDSKDAEIRSLYEKLKLLETNMEKRVYFEELDNITESEVERGSYMFDEGTLSENELDEATEIELTKASNAIDEGTHRITALVETAHFELRKARELINAGTQSTKEHDETTDLVDEGTQKSKGLDETTEFDSKKTSYSVDEEVDEGTLRSKELDETTGFDLKKTANSVDEEIQRRKEVDEVIDHQELKKTQDLQQVDGDGVDEDHGVLEVEEEIRTEIDDLRKENLELWLRFSTSYHQINRFQDSFHDLIEEIKQVKESKQEHGNGKQRHHPHHSPSSFASDIRPLYRHLRDMQTEVILWLEKSEILEDDLQHRLASLSSIQNEISDLTNDVSESETTAVPLNNYQTGKFQGEVLNMKQENVKVLNELREASERVRTLQVDIEKTLLKLDEDLGQTNRSNTSLKVPFRSILFGSKLRKKHRHSLFTCMSPSLQRQYSDLQAKGTSTVLEKKPSF